MSNVSPSNLPWQCGTCKARFFKVELLEMHLKHFHSAKKNMPSSIVQRIRSLYASAPEQPPRRQEQAEVEGGDEEDGDEPMYVVVNDDGTMYMIQNEESANEKASPIVSNIIMDENSQETTEVRTQNLQFDNSNIRLQVANGEIHVENGEVHVAEVETGDDKNEYETEEGEVITGEIVSEQCEIVTEHGEIHTEGEIETSTEVVAQDSTVEYHQVEYENGEIETYGEVQTDEDVAVEYVQYEDSSETADEQMEASDQDTSKNYDPTRSHSTPVFPCKKCDQVFSTRHDRRLHLQTHSRDLRFFCNICGRGFHRYPLLKLHANVHVEGKQHQCPHCFKFYRSVVYLKKHIAMHTNAVPPRFECGVCGVRAALRADLRRHMESHAQSSDPRPRPAPARQPNCCTVCQTPIQRGLGYSRRCADCDAKFHGHARPKRTEELGRPYTCSERGCFKSFRHPGHLRRHLATHMDDYD